MPIDLGLSRITRLLHSLGNPQKSSFKSVHIAGTNGKGSTLAFLSSILTCSNIRNGRFTSPHLVTYNDCIVINNDVYPLHKFQSINDMVTNKDKQLKLGCTEFELMTATAFKIFELEKVELALIEVGLGGRLDATNVLEPCNGKENKGGLLISGITKIAMDHENLLGNTLQEIAREKAGIIKQGCPCVVNASNKAEVIDIIKEKTKEEGSELIFAEKDTAYQLTDTYVATARQLSSFSSMKGDYQTQNLSVCLGIVAWLQENRRIFSEHNSSRISEESIKEGLVKVNWEGRLSNVSIPGRTFDILIDGTHNEDAAIELAKYLDSLASRSDGLIFVIGITSGKSLDKILTHVLEENDTLIPATFTTPENMPWISCTDPDEITKCAKSYIGDVRTDMEQPTIDTIIDYLGDLKSKGDSRKVVLCGSLYLCSDILRYVRSDT